MRSEIEETTMRFIQLCSMVFLTWSVPAVANENYTFTVTSSSPVATGSLIRFHAEVLEPQGRVPEQDERFRLYWKSNVSERDVDITKANQSSSIVKCYSSNMTKAKMYMMTVDFFYDPEMHYIGTTQVEFNITDSLNGHLDATQKTIFTNRTRIENMFSTQEPVQLFVNLTDWFKTPPTMIYDWYIDDKLIQTQNVPTLAQEFKQPGKHIIKAVAKVNVEGYADCTGYLYNRDLNGTFNVTLHMKDPVGDFLMFGKQSAKLGEGINLTAVWQSGSPPFNFTWLLKEVNGEDVLNLSSRIVSSTSANISLSPAVLRDAGQYTLLVHVENDVSVLSHKHQLTVHAEKTDPEHSAYTVVLSVMGGLVAMTIVVLVFVKVKEYRENHRNIETADFDFHPHLSSASYTAPFALDQTVVQKIRNLFRRLVGHCAKGSEQEASTSGYKPLRRYGTMEASINA